MPHPRQTPAAPRPLLVTEDPALLEAVGRIAAEAEASFEHVRTPAEARRAWPAAPLVLIGDDASTALCRASLPRREGVILIGRDLDDGSVWQRGTALGAQQVLFLPDANGWLEGLLAEAGGEVKPCGPIVAVLSGRGGAGASTLAAALALTATRAGHRTTLVDLDPIGGGIDLLFGLEAAAGPRWSELAQWRDSRLCGRSLREALPQYTDELMPGFSLPGWSRLTGFGSASRPRSDSASGPRAAAGSAYGSGSDSDSGSESAYGSAYGSGSRSGYDSDGGSGSDWGPSHDSGSGAASDGSSDAGSGSHLRAGWGNGPGAGSNADSGEEHGSGRGSGPRSGRGSASGSGSAWGSRPGPGSGDRAPGLPILTWPRTPATGAADPVRADASRAVLGALAQAGDLVVVDLPRHLDEAAVEALAVATVTLMVVPAEVRAAAAASQVAASVRLISGDLRAVVRMPSPGALAPGDVADVVGLPLAGVIGPDRRMSIAAEHGEPPGAVSRGSLAGFCRPFLDDLIGSYRPDGGEHTTRSLRGHRDFRAMA